MNKKSVFSREYDIDAATDSKLSVEDEYSILKDKEADSLIKQIELDYKLSKPRRKLIRARIIPR
jgi:hypothetical protein